MDELSKSFGIPDLEDEDGDLDFAAIFSGGDASTDPLPTIGEADPRNEPAGSTGADGEKMKDEHRIDQAANETSQYAPSAGTNRRSKVTATVEQAEQDIFSAFNSDSATPPMPKALLGQTPEQISIFDRPPVFSYGGHKDKIEDASQTFEELRIAKADDFPELEDGKSVSWRVKYGDVTKSISDPKGTSIAKMKEEIEKSKAFLDALNKGKVKEQDCLVIPSVVAKNKGTLPDYKGVFPTVEAARDSDKLICLMPAKDGRIYEMRKTEMGEFIAPKNKVADFTSIRAGFTPALPLIPQELMGQIISFFRCFMNERAEYEALVYVYWDRQEEAFVVFVPKQIATKASVHTTTTNNMLPEDRYLLYADVHSHNSMPAKFSSIDDSDEKATRLYVVIGNLDRFYPSVTARVSCGGSYIEIDPNLVMESAGAEFPVEWLDQVEQEDAYPENKTPSFCDTRDGKVLI
ncbi:MAG: hypothetical protein IJR83_01230 [Clostridia bacterium]|nr:hypothetical protein [Clostridia bacterium]